MQISNVATNKRSQSTKNTKNKTKIINYSYIQTLKNNF